MTTATAAETRIANEQRLARISSHVDADALLAAMREALPGRHDSELLFGDLSDAQVADLLDRFDRPGCTIVRHSASDWQGEHAEVRVLLPSGETCSIRVHADGVNWPGVGAVDAADAVAFAGALALAASLVATLAPKTSAR